MLAMWRPSVEVLAEVHCAGAARWADRTERNRRHCHGLANYRLIRYADLPPRMSNSA